jgi:hypothetical protein
VQATDDRGRRQAAVDPREIFNKITIGCRLSQSFPDHQRLNVRPGSAALGRNRSTSALDQSWKGCDNELYEIEFRTGEFADDFSLNFPKMEHEFADQSSDGDFANDFCLNFPKIKYEFADQSSGGEFANDFSLNFPKVKYEFADQSSDGDFANDFSLNFPKMEHKFADQSSGGEFPAVMIGGLRTPVRSSSQA